MQESELINEYFTAANYIVLCQMYLNSYANYNTLNKNDLKNYNPGHLGTSLSLNFILANLNYFLNKNSLTSRLIIGTGHSGVSLIANLWLNGTLSKYYSDYTGNKNGLNNLIRDFGTVIRSEINPQYPESIYDGGELGYSLGVAYGYALNSNEDIIPCIIGDGEAETGTLCSAWQLNKLLKTKSKVLPIINLNGLKMGSQSFLSRLSNDELIGYYSSLGYQVNIVDGLIDDNVLSVIDSMQNALTNAVLQNSPLIIFKTKKGYTLPKVNSIPFENTLGVHKNPLQIYELDDKFDIIRNFLQHYTVNIFDKNNELNSNFLNFRTSLSKQNSLNVNKIDFDDEKCKGIKSLEAFLIKFIKNNNLKVFSPDEIFSNQLGGLKSDCFELLNENLLQALYQGYVQAGNNGLYVSYESFMPIITSMVAQYYKYLKQKENLEKCPDTFSMNYLLTSTCWENTYSHQNPEFVNSLLQRDDSFYSIYYPKDGAGLVKSIKKALTSKNQINVVVTSKRHSKEYRNYGESNIAIETIVNCSTPEIILCATGDYMLDIVYQVYEKLKIVNENIKIVYVTNPKLLDKNSKNGLSDAEFFKYFSPTIPTVYLFAGYPSIIKSLLYERKINCEVLGYNDQISICGRLSNNTMNNGLSANCIEDICKDKLKKDINILRRTL